MAQKPSQRRRAPASVDASTDDAELLRQAYEGTRQPTVDELARRSANSDRSHRARLSLSLLGHLQERVSAVLPNRPQLRKFHDDNADMSVGEYLAVAIDTGDAMALAAVVGLWRSQSRPGVKEHDWITTLAWLRTTTSDLGDLHAELAAASSANARAAILRSFSTMRIGARLSAVPGLAEEVIKELPAIADLAIRLTAFERGVTRSTLEKMRKPSHAKRATQVPDSTEAE